MTLNNQLAIIPPTICTQTAPCCEADDDERMNAICNPLISRGLEFRAENDEFERGCVTAWISASGRLVVEWMPAENFSPHQ